MKLIFGQRRLFLDLGGVGVSETPLGVTQKFQIIRVLILVPLRVGLPVDRHVCAGRQCPTQRIRMQDVGKRKQKGGLRTSQVSMR